MDPKLLEQKLSQVAEWDYPCVTQDGANERLIIPGEPKTNHYNLHKKLDLGPRIIKIRDDIALRPCAWCGKILNQRQNITKRTIPRRGDNPEIIKWHYHCFTCNKVWDPELKTLKWSNKSNNATKKKINKRVNDEK